MAYFVKSKDENKIVLERFGLGCMHNILIIIGLPLWLYPTWIMIANFSSINFDGQMGSGVVVLVVPLLGFMFFLGGAFLIPGQHRKLPKHVVFDHQIAAIRIAMRGSKTEAIIPYTDIEGFHIIPRSDSISGSSDLSIEYHVFATKKDGGEWYLIQYGTRQEADNFIAYLMENVPLDKPCTATMTLPVKAVALNEDSHLSFAQWRNRISAGYLAVVTFTIMFGLMSIVAMFGTLLAIPFLLATIALIVLSYKYTQHITTRFVVKIYQGKIDFYHFPIFSRAKKEPVSMPIEMVKRVIYNFDPFRRGSSSIMILTQKDIDYMERYRGDEIKALFDLFKGENKPLTFILDSLTPVEGLQLEKWFELQLRKYGSNEVIL